MEIADIRPTLSKLKEIYGELNKRDAKVSSYYALKEIPKTPSVELVPLVPPTARTIPEALVAALNPTDITVTVPQRTEKAGKVKAEEQSKQLQLAHKDWLGRLNVSTGFSKIQELFRQSILYGRSVLKGPFLNINLWSEQPKRRDGEKGEDFDLRQEQWENQRKTTLPIEAFPIYPAFVFPDPNVFAGNKPSYVMENYRRLSTTLPANWVVGADPKEEIEYTEYSDDRKRIYFVGDNPVHWEEHNYPWSLYHIAFSGLGLNSPTGNPEDKAVGIMYPILSRLLADIKLHTVAAWLAQIYGLPPLAKETPFTDPIDFTPLTVNSETVKLRRLFETPTDAGNLVLNMLALNSAGLEQDTYSQALSAMKLSGVSTGIQQQLLTLQAYKRFEAMVQSLESLWGEVGSQMAWIVENKLKFAINEHIKPSEIAGYYACKVHFVIVEALQMQADIEMMRMLQGVYSTQTLREHFAPIEPAEDEDERMFVEGLLQLPDFKQAVAQLILQRRGGQQALQTAQIGKVARQFQPPAQGTQGVIQ